MEATAYCVRLGRRLPRPNSAAAAGHAASPVSLRRCGRLATGAICSHTCLVRFPGAKLAAVRHTRSLVRIHALLSQYHAWIRLEHTLSPDQPLIVNLE